VAITVERDRKKAAQIPHRHQRQQPAREHSPPFFSTL
jgi:hypothetical protein